MSVERKHVLTLGPLTHPATGKVIDINEEFVENLRQNLIYSNPEYVPIVMYANGGEEPQRHVGEVNTLAVEGDKVYAEFVLDIDLDLKRYDAFPMMHLNYHETGLGLDVGPALIHILLKPRPVVTGPSGL